ncbi:centromere protein S-like [Vanessa tameamea]|uniref:Centromere protein S n=1 Tax=Vanessa tameamea TaxID=334116 RepID=A0A8B8I5F2_VANTA|nr:centromere protein S-like [Vanessa tameamea]
MTLFEYLSTSEKVRSALHRDVVAICTEASHCLGLEITRPATAIIAELVFRKISAYGLDLEAFAKHAKRSVINQDDVKLLARRNSSLRDRLNGICKNTPSVSKDKRRKTTVPVVKPESTRKEVDDENQSKKQKVNMDDEFNLPGPSKISDNMITDDPDADDDDLILMD